MGKWFLTLLFTACGACGSIPESEEVYVPDPSVPIPEEIVTEVDPSQILTPLPSWRGWCYEGPSALKEAFVGAVEWWRINGRDLGSEDCGNAKIRIVDLSDRPGPNGEWAQVSYRGDIGADIRVYEGLRNATALEIVNGFRHEIGHVVGLQHSRDPRCLMYGDGLSRGGLCDHERSLLGHSLE